MNLRRLPMLAVAVAGLTAVVWIARDGVPTTPAVFSEVASPWMPVAPQPGGLSSTWFCPGVPASGERSEGTVTVFNTEASDMRGTLTILTESTPITQPFTVAPYGNTAFDVYGLVDDALVPNGYAAAVVEIEGGGGLVEQLAVRPVGTNSVGESIAACANSPSGEWFLSTGDSSDESTSMLVLSNPHGNAAVVDVTISTARGERSIDGFAVPAQTVRVIDLAESSVDDADIGVTVDTTVGSVVVGRAQTYDTPTRDGYSMTLAATRAHHQWWFAAGQVADDVTVEYSIYNPSDDDVEVSALPLGYLTSGEFIDPVAITVPAGKVEMFSLDSLDGLPEGPVSALFSVEPGSRIVVERILTREINGIRTSSVTPGATPRFDDYVPDTWYLGLGSPDPEVPGVLQILNTVAADATVTVQAITPNGVENVAGMEAITLPASATITVDLPAVSVQGSGEQALILRSTAPVFVERVLPREDNAQGRVASWLLPAG